MLLRPARNILAGLNEKSAKSGAHTYLLSYLITTPECCQSQSTSEQEYDYSPPAHQMLHDLRIVISGFRTEQADEVLERDVAQFPDEQGFFN